MSNNTIITKIEELKELEDFIEEIKAEAETIRDSLKAEMLERGVEELEAGAYIVRWTPVLSTRFDSSRFKRELPDIYPYFLKQTSSRRFTISA